jgi:membrane-associated phospholipid phosphatase
MPDSMAAPRPHLSRPLALAAVLVIAGTVALWAHYGTAVFYETILAGIAACF